MGNIYSTNSEANLMIYSYRQFVYLKLAVGEKINRSVLLANDYKDSLSEAIYADALYYAYRSIRDELVVKSILDAAVCFRIAPTDAGECSAPQLLTAGETLLLCYAVRNPVNDRYGLRGSLPVTGLREREGGQTVREPEKPILLPGVYSAAPTLHAVSCGTGAFLLADSGCETAVYFLEQTGSVVRYQSTEQLEEERTHRQKQEWQRAEAAARLREQEGQLKDAKQTEAELLRQLQEKTAETERQAALIESIKKQYDELMDTAIQYRAEARKWYGKFRG